MLLVSGSYGEVCAALVGFDKRHGAGVLTAFRSWLADRHPKLGNLGFASIAAAEALQRTADIDVRELSPDEDAAARAKLLELLDEFLNGPMSAAAESANLVQPQPTGVGLGARQHLVALLEHPNADVGVLAAALAVELGLREGTDALQALAKGRGPEAARARRALAKQAARTA
jgi:hypothetical protein